MFRDIPKPSVQSEWQDLNLRPLRSERSTLTKLRYTPTEQTFCDFTMMVGVKGFELLTPRSQSECSTRLSYTPIVIVRYILDVVESDGVEPTTFCLQSRRSTN